MKNVTLALLVSVLFATGAHAEDSPIDWDKFFVVCEESIESAKTNEIAAADGGTVLLVLKRLSSRPGCKLYPHGDFTDWTVSSTNKMAGFGSIVYDRKTDPKLGYTPLFMAIDLQLKIRDREIAKNAARKKE